MAQMNAWQLVLGLGVLVALLSVLADALGIVGNRASATNRARGSSWESPSSSRARGGSTGMIAVIYARITPKKRHADPARYLERPEEEPIL